jgi:hypothetical protein
MLTWKSAAATIAVAALTSTAALAQSSTDSEMQPQPPPSSAAPAGEGSSSGSSGYESPAGIPADPSTTENQQPGMSPQRPSDPATGSQPDARVPTAPEGTGNAAP